MSVEDAISGKYGDGSNIQVHGTITDLKVNDCLLVDDNFTNYALYVSDHRPVGISLKISQ